MSAAIFDKPASPSGNVFVEALLGLASACRRLDGAAFTGKLVELVPADRPEMIDAVLGALSLGKTIDILITAVCDDANLAATPESATWQRELLR